MQTVQFFKYQALGNDMVVIDPTKFALPLTAASARLICDRNFGLGADGICYGPTSRQGLKMRFLNPDGSESLKSGNGLRIFARYLWDYHYVSSLNFTIQIADEQIDVKIEDDAARTITTTMGQLSFSSRHIPVAGPARAVVEEKVAIDGMEYRITAVTLGNPHCVIFTDSAVTEQARQVGPKIEVDELFPQRTNVQCVQIIDQHTIEIGIWERGAGYTLASGSSACAAAGAAIKTGRCLSPVTVKMAGGTALVTMTPTGQVALSGRVEAVAAGEFAPDFIDRCWKGHL